MGGKEMEGQSPSSMASGCRSIQFFAIAFHWPVSLALLTLKHFADKGRC